MNSQEAITLLRNLEDALDSYCELNEEGKKAFRMAIAALELFGNAEQLPSAQPERLTDYSFEESCTECPAYDTENHRCPRFNQVIRTALKDANLEPCEDCISRQAIGTMG